jgi:hypothetical protein
MSLDVYLRLPGPAEPGPVVGRIFVRRGGARVEISRAEWDRLNPDREPIVVVSPRDARELYRANITSNLAPMADEAGLYKPLWQPAENGISHANQLLEPLRTGLARLETEHGRLQAFNPANGWGDYQLLLRFTRDYLTACERWPDAEVRVWR